MIELKKNDTVQVEITDLSKEGMGIGRVEGIVVFVEGALPQESVEAKIIKVTKSYCVGKLLNVSKPSPLRTQPPCPVFHKCGGCSLQHLQYMGQLMAKHGQVQSCLKKIGGCDAEVGYPLPSRNPFGYRNKCAFPVAKGEDGQVVIGCYARRSHRVIPIERCLIQQPGTENVLRAVKEFMEKYHIPPYQEQSRRGLVRHVICRMNKWGEVMVGLVICGNRLEHERELVQMLKLYVDGLSSVVINQNTSTGNVILGEKSRALYGEEYLLEEIMGLKFQISLNSFLQVNPYGMELLYTNALKLAALQRDDVVVDLYCGAGTISLCAAQRCGKVYGVEIVPQAIENAQKNAQLNGISNAEFLLGDCGEVFPQIRKREGKIDVIIVDPPRKGLSQQVISSCIEAQPRKIIYVSCDPATLARDIKLFAQSGYLCEGAQPVDMFPQTMHVETVVLLSYKKTDSVIDVKVEFGEGEGKVPLDNITKRVEAYKRKSELPR